MNIVVTGASGGIGYNTVLELLKMESSHIFAVSRNLQKLEGLHMEALKQNSPGKLEIIDADVVNKKDRQRLKSVIEKHSGSIDILINNAGKLVNKPFGELRSEDWEDVFSTNVFAVAGLISELFPLLLRADIKSYGYRSHIVNIGSMGGLGGTSKFKGLSAYSSSKAALAILTECMAEEFKDEKIAVNGLALGSVGTEMFTRAFPGMKASMSSEFMANYVADFAIRGAGYFNGKNLPVSNSTP